MATVGLTAVGLTVERFPEARERIVGLWRSRMGQNSPTGPGTENGLVIDVIGLAVALVWESAAGVHSGSYLRSGVDRSLDEIVGAFGFERIPASPSTAVVTFYGTAEATVIAGSLVEADTGIQWTGQVEAELGDGIEGLVWAVRLLEVVDGTYELTITGEPTYTLTGPGTLPELAVAFVAEISASSLAVAVYAGDDLDGFPILVLRSLDDTPIEVVVDGPLDLFAAVDVDVRATVTGPNLAGAGAIRILPFAISGIEGVINEADALEGAERETNPALRTRFILGQGVHEKSTARAVVSALLRLAALYKLQHGEAIARENTSAVEVDGLPPHSMSPLVYLPGVPAEDIATALLFVKTNGYQCFGEIETVLVDSKGSAITIGHTEATEAYLHVRFTVVTVGSAWPGDTGYNAIEAGAAAWLTLPGRLSIGVDLYRLDLSGAALDQLPAFAVKALTVELAITAAPGDVPTFAAADLVVSSTTVLIPAASRVSAVPA